MFSAEPPPPISKQSPMPMARTRLVAAILSNISPVIAMRILLIVAAVGTLAIITAGLFLPATPNALSVARTATSSGSQITVGLQVGNAAPNFTLSDLNGKRVSLSDFRGRPVMLNFWYSACPGCLIEMPGMQRYYKLQQAVSASLVILGVNTIDDVQTTRQFVQAEGITYPIVLADGSSVVDLYSLVAAPTSYFIDRQGIIRAREIGPVDDATLRQRVAQIS